MLPPIAQVKGYTTIHPNLLLYLSLQNHELNKPFFYVKLVATGILLNTKAD